MLVGWMLGSVLTTKLTISALRAVCSYSDETACWQILILNLFYWLLTV